MGLFDHIINVLLDTIRDVIPIMSVIIGFQVLVIKKPLPNLGVIIKGFILVILGLAFFLVGLQEALFPLGKLMAEQLTDPAFIHGTVVDPAQAINWHEYMWVYIFAAATGFATTIAEPALKAVALKASDVSGGTVSVRGLRVTVAIGVSVGVALGTHRIVVGAPLHYYIIIGYLVVIVQTFFAPKSIIAVAYDSGGVTTSTVTVPLLAALGLGLASTIPGRNPVIDGFGLIAFAALFPIISVMGYAQLGQWRYRKQMKKLGKQRQESKHGSDK
ncbi:MAG: DUF1538 domain-containing protein [Gammaproteobacteria bacterium]|nr:MAG: DUF1538 domain-containing protein [Gammaproteobacteria bacterium]